MSDLDRKLHRVILTSSPRYTTEETLAKAIENGQYEEFQYVRDGEIRLASWKTVRKYVSFAERLGLLESNYRCATNKSEVNSVPSFQAWAGECLVQFVQDTEIDSAALQNAVSTLVLSNKKTLPTTDKLYDEVNPAGVNADEFRWALQLQADLRPATLALCRKWIWIPNGMYSF